MSCAEYKQIINRPNDRWKVLANLVLLNKCQIIAEIGMSKGENARGILKVLSDNRYRVNKFYLIDIPEQEQRKFYGNPAGMYRHAFHGLKDCTYLDQGSIEASKLIEDNTIDLIFMDGDTSCYESVKRDILLYLPKLSKNGVICGRYFDLTPETSHCYTSYIKVVVDEIFKPEDISLHVLLEQNSGKTDYLWWYSKG